MQRHVLLVLVVACAGLIFVSTGHASESLHAAEVEELQWAARKLMQEKEKVQLKGGVKGNGEGGGVKGKGEGGEKKAAVKKAKKPLEEEDDEDIRFMEEETRGIDSGRGDLPSAKTKTPVNKSNPSKTTAKKSEDSAAAAEVVDIENLDGGGAKKELQNDAKKEKKAYGKAKTSAARKPRKQPVDDLIVEKIEDDDAGSVEVKKGAPAATLVKKKKTDQRIKSAEEGAAEGDGHAEELDDIKKEVATSSNQKKAGEKKKTTEETLAEEDDSSSEHVEDVSSEPQDDEEIIPVNIDDEDVAPEHKEVEEKPEIKTVPVKKPSAASRKEQSKPKAKDKKESDKGGLKSKPLVDAKTTAPVKKSSNSTKKTNDLKKKAEVPKKNESFKETKKETKTKKEQIPINFSERATEDVEDLHVGSTVTDPDEEDEEINFVDEVTKLPSKFQETAGNVANTLMPGIQKLSEKSRTYFSSANEQMTQRFAPYVGEQVAPVVASLISYALLLIPLIVVLYMLERIRATLSLAKVLFFVNLYLGAYFVTLVLATFALHSEPMAFLFRNARSSCIFLQLLQALGFVLYLVLYTVVFFKSCSSGNFLDKLASGFQWVIVALFGLHYYVTVFHKAMAMKLPRTNWKIYLVYSSAFAVLALFARAKIEPVKKEYFYSPVDDPDEVIPVDKRS